MHMKTNTPILAFKKDHPRAAEHVTSLERRLFEIDSKIRRNTVASQVPRYVPGGHTINPNRESGLELKLLDLEAERERILDTRPTGNPWHQDDPEHPTFRELIADPA
jgi:hypothetical protein